MSSAECPWLWGVCFMGHLFTCNTWDICSPISIRDHRMEGDPSDSDSGPRCICVAKEQENSWGSYQRTQLIWLVLMYYNCLQLECSTSEYLYNSWVVGCDLVPVASRGLSECYSLKLRLLLLTQAALECKTTVSSIVHRISAFCSPQTEAFNCLLKVSIAIGNPLSLSCRSRV
jgi:hypothetical protein